MCVSIINCKTDIEKVHCRFTVKENLNYNIFASSLNFSLNININNNNLIIKI